MSGCFLHTHALAGPRNGLISLAASEDVAVKSKIAIIVASIGIASAAIAADPVVGTWKTDNGELADIAPCGPSFCITAKTGDYAGQKLGSFKAGPDAFTGRITDPRNKATYSGKLPVDGDRLKLRGCATPVLCKTQSWTRAAR